jgi:hypothetical protein
LVEHIQLLEAGKYLEDAVPVVTTSAIGRPPD